jgi:hydrogenase expression/formation protein HypE
VLLNIFEEHFDHYLTPDDYYNAKKNIFKYQTQNDILIYGDIFQHCSNEEIEKAKSFLDLVSVVPEGVAAGEVGTHGMHDITEGGILGAVWEMCQISHTGAEVWEDDIPMHPETEKICSLFDVDPLRLISSGSMIIIVPKEKRAEMEDAMKAAGVDASVIGIITEEKEGICMAKHTLTCGSGCMGRIKVKIDPPYADEIYKTYKSSEQGE